MARSSHSRSVRLGVETLEDRLTPAGTVTGSLANGVWKLTGDDFLNRIQVTSAGSPGAFTVVPGGTTVIGVTNPTGVHKIVFDMKGGDDDVTVDVAKLTNMVFQGGDGANTFVASRFRLTNKLTVTNGLGYDAVRLENFKIDGNVNINNGDGGSNTILSPTLGSALGGFFNQIGQNLSITNGIGTDFTRIFGTNVGGNVTVNNGAGDGTDAGYVKFNNNFQATKRATIGGNVKVSFQDGKINDNGIYDTVVHGNVVFNNGSGDAKTYFDGFYTMAPVRIDGKLKIVGTGTNLVSVGRQYKHTGLRVGHDLIIDTVNPADLTLQAFNLVVNGQTKII